MKLDVEQIRSGLQNVPFITRRRLDVARRLLRHKFAIIGLLSLLVMIIFAALAPYIAPYDPVEQNFDASLQSPNSDHVFGTDSYGRDVLSRTIHGARISVRVGLSVVTVSILLGVPIGLIAGFYSTSIIDDIIMRIVDAMLAFPSIILALVIVTVLGNSINNVIIALSITNTLVFIRLVRGNVLSIKEENYIASARAAGSTNRKIMTSYLLPNVSAPIIVQGTLVFAFAILQEAALSFLGIGAQPPTPSWGIMLQAGKTYLDQAIWMSIFPGLAIMITVLSLNFVGDGLRDVLDPRYTDENLR